MEDVALEQRHVELSRHGHQLRRVVPGADALAASLQLHVHVREGMTDFGLRVDEEQEVLERGRAFFLEMNPRVQPLDRRFA